MNPKESLEKQLEQLGQTVSRDDAFVANVMARINAAEPGRIKQNNKLIFRSLIMNRFTKFAAAAVIIMAVILSVTFFNKTVPTASASEFLSEACQALSNINSIHIKAQMRTLPADNFSMIGLKYDFVPIELWKKTDASGQVKWKVEKPGRILAMDGGLNQLLITIGLRKLAIAWLDAPNLVIWIIAFVLVWQWIGTTVQKWLNSAIELEEFETASNLQKVMGFDNE